MLCIVDPYPEDRQAVSEFIARLGYRVQEFATAASLLLVQEAENDITGVVAELDLPDMTGIALAEAIHRLRPDIPVIILTRSSDIASAVQAHKSKVDAYMPKPFVERRLAACLAELLGRS